MKKNDVFLKGSFKLVLKECNLGYFLVAHQNFKSGKHFDTTLAWVSQPPEGVDIEIIKKEVK